MKLVGIHEMALALGVSRQRVNVLTTRDDFPKPVASLHMGRVWRLSDFEKWRAKNGR